MSEAADTTRDVWILNGILRVQTARRYRRDKCANIHFPEAVATPVQFREPPERPSSPV